MIVVPIRQRGERHVVLPFQCPIKRAVIVVPPLLLTRLSAIQVSVPYQAGGDCGAPIIDGALAILFGFSALSSGR